MMLRTRRPAAGKGDFMSLHLHQVIDANFDRECALYDGLREELEREHFGHWALIHQDELAGVYATLETAKTEGARRFGAGQQYLIRQIGGPPYSALTAEWTFY